MKHYIYKITNTKNGMIYVGYHKTKDQNDNYLGSGSKIREAVKEFGSENFSKEILFEFSSREEALLKEKEIVTREFVASEITYNMIPGGHGGFDYVNENRLNLRTGMIHKTDSKKKMGRKGRVVSEEMRTKLKETSYKALLKKLGSPEAISNHFSKINAGKVSSKETKARISKSVIDSYSSREEAVCPHCGSKSRHAVFHRYHFDKCKSKSLL